MYSCRRKITIIKSFSID